jgi:hypothetical protein
MLSGPRAWFWISRALVHRRLIVTHRTLDDQVLLGRIRGLRPDVGLHAVGVIYRRPLIDCSASAFSILISDRCRSIAAGA